MNWINEVHFGDCRDTMRRMIADGVKVQTCITSPPYWGLRSYLPDGHPDKGRELGLEPTPELYVANMLEVFSLVRDLLADDGVLWLNLGDSYMTGAGSYRNPGSDVAPIEHGGKHAFTKDYARAQPNRMPQTGYKPKDLGEIPSEVVRALRLDGWYVRSRIPWLKRNAMPESAKDRPTTAVEYVFLLSKGERYFYDAEAIKQPASLDTNARYARGRSDTHKWADGGPGNQTIAKSFEHILVSRSGNKDRKYRGEHGGAPGSRSHQGFGVPWEGATRSRRNSDWFMESWEGLLSNEDGDPLALIVNPRPYSEAHFATFPPKLVEPMVLAGSRSGDIVFDPFIGSGTTGEVAQKLGRRWIGCDLQVAYAPLQAKRTAQQGLIL